MFGAFSMVGGRIEHEVMAAAVAEAEGSIIRVMAGPTYSLLWSGNGTECRMGWLVVILRNGLESRIQFCSVPFH